MKKADVKFWLEKNAGWVVTSLLVLGLLVKQCSDDKGIVNGVDSAVAKIDNFADKIDAQTGVLDSLDARTIRIEDVVVENRDTLRSVQKDVKHVDSVVVENNKMIKECCGAKKKLVAPVVPVAPVAPKKAPVDTVVVPVTKPIVIRDSVLVCKPAGTTVVSGDNNTVVIGDNNTVIVGNNNNIAVAKDTVAQVKAEKEMTLVKRDITVVYCSRRHR